MIPINPHTVPGNVQMPLWLLVSLCVGLVVVAWWAIRRKDERDAEREKRANEKEDALLAAREKWTEAVLKMATAQEQSSHRLERVESAVQSLERAFMNGHKKAAA